MADHTVLLRRGALGDVVLLGAVTGSLPGRVTVVTDPRWMPVAAALRGVTAVCAWPGRGAPAAHGPWQDLLDLHDVTRVIDLQGDVQSARLARRLGPTTRWHKGSLARRLRLLRLGPGRGSVVLRYAEACGVAVAPRPWIGTPDGARLRLALIPGAAWTTKRPPLDLLLDAASAWRGPVVVLGGPGDEARVGDVVRAVPGAEGLLESGFERTLQALATCGAAVGGDTGLLHLAAACGVPVVHVFGPTHPDDGFAGHPGAVLPGTLWCSPCALHGRHGCPRGLQRCMDHDPQALRDALRAVQP